MLEMEAEPFVIDNDFFRNMIPGEKKAQLFIRETEQVITATITHKQPAFLGELYPISISMKQKEDYEVVQLLAVFCEITESEKSNEKTDKKTSSNRKASVVSIDSNDDDWNYILYTMINNSMQKLTSHDYNITDIFRKTESIDFYMQFREEGRANFDLIFRYTAKKILKDGSKTNEFTMENKLSFYVDVLCPFILKTEWVTPDPCMNCINERLYRNNGRKTYLKVNEKNMLGVKVSAGSFPLVEVHDMKLKIKNDGETVLIRDCTGDLNDHNEWPITLGLSESLSSAFCIQPLIAFNDKQIADIKISWNRVDNQSAEKIICAIPIPMVNAIGPCLSIEVIQIPDKVYKFKEFFVAYKLQNITSSVLDIKLGIEDSKEFFITGEMETKITIPSYGTDELKIGLHPTKCGKLTLPNIIASIITSNVASEAVIDGNYRYSIYCFPS